MPSALRPLTIAAALALAAHVALTATGRGSAAVDGFVEGPLYHALMLGAAAACVLRALVVRADRAAWALLGLGALSWSLGDVGYALVYADAPDPPFPSVADAFYLAWYPACCAALGLLVRAHVRDFSLSLAVDAVTGALAVSAAAAAVLHDAVALDVGGDPLSIAATLAYPVCDVLLLGFVTGLIALTGWRPGVTWGLIAAALALAAIGDAAYLVAIAGGAYAEGSVLDSVWPASLLLLAVAAWRRADFGAPRLDSRLILLAPTLFGMTAMVLIAVDQVTPLSPVAVALACLTIASLLVRMAVTLTENLRMVTASRGEALTDALTGLGNRRRLVAELETTLADANRAAPRILLLFDLDGFKRYNDAFGHLAGDALLARLGARFAGAVGERGAAYRLGGDEFCALLDAEPDRLEEQIARTAVALSESGDGFAITTSYGAVLLPQEAADASTALGLADERMYARKGDAAVRSDARVAVVRALRARIEPTVVEPQGPGLALRARAADGTIEPTDHHRVAVREVAAHLRETLAQP